MSPHDASALVKKLATLFEVEPLDCDLLQRALEAFISLPFVAAEKILSRFAQEQDRDQFERARFLTLLREENARRSRRNSETPEWAAKKLTDQRCVEAELRSAPTSELDRAIEQARREHPIFFRDTNRDPLEREMCRSLIYTHLRNRKLGHA